MRFPIPAPRSDEGTVVPASLLAVLLAMAAVQLWLAGLTEALPEAVSVRAMSARYAAPSVKPVAVPPSIIEQPIFAPQRTLGGGGGSVDAANPLDGAVVAGTVAIRGRVRLLLRQPDGLVVDLFPGQEYHGWRLTGLSHQGGRFSRNSEAITIPFGASAPPTGGPAGQQEQEEAE